MANFACTKHTLKSPSKDLLNVTWNVCRSDDSNNVYFSINQDDPNWGVIMSFKAILERVNENDAWVDYTTTSGSVHATEEKHFQFSSIPRNLVVRIRFETSWGKIWTDSWVRS